MKTKGKRTSQADKLSDFERRLSGPIGLPHSPEEFEELKKAMRLRWQRGYDDAVAGRPINLDESGRASPDYFGGIRCRRSGTLAAPVRQIRGIETANRCAVPQNSNALCILAVLLS